MALFPANPTRLDPYKNFKFRLKWDGQYVAGISKVSSLKRSTQVVKHRDGGNPSMAYKLPGATDYDPITLERGLTQDLDFVSWADAAQVLDKGAPTTSLKNLRRELRIDLLNEAGQPVWRYFVHRCWVSEYQALPDLDAGANAIAIEHIKLENEGWERDTTLTEPLEI